MPEEKPSFALRYICLFIITIITTTISSWKLFSEEKTEERENSSFIRVESGVCVQ